MKQLFAILLCIALIFSLAACGGNKPDSTSEAPGAEDTVSDPEAEPEPEATPTPPPVNPLTGQDPQYPGYRPVAVMIQNSPAALPQWGLSSACLLIEGLTEGRTSCLMAVFPSVEELPKTGPVAPLRDLPLQFVLPLNAVPVHNGTNIYASNLLNLLSYQNLDGYYIGTISFDYDKDRHAAGYNDEFCWYTTSQLVKNGLDTYATPVEGELTALFSFSADAHPAPEAVTAARLGINYSTACYRVLQYEEETGRYRLYNGDEPLTDANDGNAIAVDNVFILYAAPSVKDDEYTRDYDLSSGIGLMLARGGWQEILWQKNGPTGRLLVYDLDGSELAVNTGSSYIGIYGAFNGQGISLTDADGQMQTLPEMPDTSAPEEAPAEEG